ncbi:MAG TPA: DUF5703 domain-containing protein, partial [Chthonomonadaceae bacterium]|nr:DUF5703 domain-containing protein [Chthonomonadaceae bacterium]
MALTAENTAHAVVPNGKLPANNGIAFNGTALNVDYAAYLAQHDLVYQVPPSSGTEAMPMGDGDLGVSLWCPKHLTFQIQKSDLWADPPTAPENTRPQPQLWRQLSAGALSILGESELLAAPTHFEQRLSLYNGIITLKADAAQGSCQMTAFVAATAGVLVVHYQDQTLRNSNRQIELSLWRDANMFALNETIGVLQALRDRRYALIARVEGKRVQAKMVNRRSTRLEIEPYRSGGFTLYVSVATSPRDGDPVRVAKSRIEAAMAKGYETLLREQKQHWSLFWQKSFLRLEGPSSDNTPHYLENLWYNTLYHLACCSRGFDAPLANGSVFLHNGDERRSPALYRGVDLRAMMAPLLPANHLELTVPYVETCSRILPDLAARTGRDYGVGGARYPAVFNRFGDEFPDKAGASAPTPSQNDGLDTALLIWDAWRHAPDPFFLGERAYPLLLASTTFALERALADPQSLADPNEKAKLASALQALLWASAEYELDADRRPEWIAGLKALGQVGPARLECLQPLGELTPENAAVRLRSWLLMACQQPQGFLTEGNDVAALHAEATLATAINSMLLREEDWQANLLSSGLPSGNDASGFGGIPAVLRVFPALPEEWNGTFSLAAP